MTQAPGGQPHIPGFWEIARLHPEWVAVVAADGTNRTYGEFAVMVNRLSHGLRSFGLEPGDRLAVVLTNRIEFLAVVLAAAQIGTYVTLINTHLTIEEVASILADSGARLVITEAGLADSCNAAADRAGLPAQARFSIDGGEGIRRVAELIAGQPATLPDGRVGGRPLLYTSGTSGRPKGVKLPLPPGEPEISVIPGFEVLLRRFDIDPSAHIGDGVHLLTSPLYHSAPAANAMLALHIGHRIILMSKWTPEATLELIARHRVTWTHMVPTMFNRLLHLPEPVRSAADTASLRWLIHAAAPCPVVVKRRMLDWLGPIVFEYYASTEVGGTAIGPREWVDHPGSVGRPWEGADVRILDERGESLPPGEVGRVYLRETRGFEYHNDAEKTEQVRDGDYITVGDLGWLDDDGFLYLADRRTDLIISGGVNIYPAEVEAALLEHASVADAAVIGVPDSNWGQQLHAVVQAVAGIATNSALADELVDHCRSRLAGFKCPRIIEFRAELPRTETGKLLRRQLRDAYWPPAGSRSFSPGGKEGAGQIRGDPEKR